MYNIESIRAILAPFHGQVDSKRFFKTGAGDYSEHDQFIGVSIPTLRKIAKDLQSITYDCIKDLLYSKINEERLLALIILTDRYKKSVDARREILDFYILHLSRVNNWNLVDASAHLILGAHSFDNNDVSIIDKLVKSNNLWERRIAIVGTWYFIRKGQVDLTLKLAALLLEDKEDLMHKATGWMLREVGKKNESALIAFLEKYSSQMPRTMFRYAIERLK